MKVLVIVTEDWFVLSHFVPLLKELKALAGDVVVATRSTGRLSDVEQLGVRVRPFDMRRGSLNVSALLNVRGGLARIFDQEAPDVVHAVSMQAVVMTSLALPKAARPPSIVILHLTGLGYLGQSRSPTATVLRSFANAAIRRATSGFDTWLLAENSDDIARLVAGRAVAQARTAVVPGCGIDPALYPALDAPANPVARAAFVGRMLRSKGVDVLVQAHKLLADRGVGLDLDLYGAADVGSRQAIPPGTLWDWNGQAGISWHGRTENIVDVWRSADVAVTPSLGGEGMPRAMMEAAACGRPLVVSDVPGCRQFVRDGVEGFVVPPGDPEALAEALGRLASDPGLRLRMGAAARRRVLESYSEDVVRARLREVYRYACETRGERPTGEQRRS